MEVNATTYSFIKRITCLGSYDFFDIHNIVNWATPIMEFLETAIEPQEKSDAERVRRLAPRYTLLNKVLYKKGFSTPYLICIAHPKTMTILRELHEGYIAFY